MKRAVIYTRVSRDDSGEGKSNARQREDCEKLADLRGWSVVGTHEDISISAYSGKDRPAWNEVLRLARAGEIDLIIAWHIDRMTRSMTELEQLILLAEECGVGIATVTGDMDLTTDVGRMVARILAAVARQEVERKGARQRSANKQRAAAGQPHAHPRPFGYEDDRLTPREIEANAIRTAADDVLAGTPISEITRRWVEAGFSSSMSGEAVAGWSTPGVRKVLLNPRYAGLRTYGGEVIGDAEWQALIPLETHLALRELLESPGRTKGTVRLGRTPSALLTGIAVCSLCEATVRGNSRRGVPTYRCPSSHADLKREEADALVRAVLAHSIGFSGLGSLVPAKSDGRARAVGQVEAIQARLNELSTAYANGHLTIEQLNNASALLRTRLEEAEQGASTLTDAGQRRYNAWQEATHFIKLDLHAQRKVLQEIARIEVRPRAGRRGIADRELLTVWVTDVAGNETVAFDESGIYVPREANVPWTPPDPAERPTSGSVES